MVVLLTAPALDRYAARCANFALVVTRIAVLGAQSAPKDTGNQPRGSAGISRGRAPWLVGMVPRSTPGLRPLLSGYVDLEPARSTIRQDHPRHGCRKE